MIVTPAFCVRKYPVTQGQTTRNASQTCISPGAAITKIPATLSGRCSFDTNSYFKAYVEAHVSLPKFGGASCTRTRIAPGSAGCGAQRFVAHGMTYESERSCCAASVSLARSADSCRVTRTAVWRSTSGTLNT